MHITLYYYPHTRAFRIRWLLEELGLDYQLHKVNLFRGEGDSDAYRKIHPLGHLPAIEVDGQAMFESGAICNWLADCHPAAGLAPAADAPQRKDFLQWMYFVPGEVEPPLFYHVLHARVLRKSDRVAEILPWLKQRYLHVLKALQQQLQDKHYLLGDEFSAADLMLGSTINWMPDLLQDYPALPPYIERLAQRSAFQRALAD